MKPGIYNYPDNTRGDTINAHQYTLTDVESGDPKDLTGCVIRRTLRNGIHEVKMSIGDGILVSDPPSGVVAFDEFKLQHAGLWRYDDEFTFPGEVVKTYVKGSIRIYDDITK